MILDDHELANEFDNDLDSKKQMYHRPIGAYRVDGLKAYNEFQHSHNPTTDDGVYYFNFDYAGIPFFVMDVRADRMRSTGKMIDKAQMSAFTAWLRKNSDKLKMVVSAVPFITRVINFAMNPKDKWPSDIFIGQRNEILKYIAEGDIHKTIFLTGDIHSAALASLKLERAGLPDIELNEIVAGPMSQKITNGKVTVLRKEHNSLLTASTNMRYNCTVYSRLQYWPRLVKKKDANVCVVKVNIPDASVTFNWWRIHDFPGLGPKLVTDDIKIPQG